MSTAMAQVNGPGPSPSSAFDNVLNLPGDESIVTGVTDESVGGVSGQTTQLNVNSGGSVGLRFDANSGSEINISGGTVSNAFDANPGSEVNISGGTVGPFIRAFDGSVVNISGGVVGVDPSVSGTVGVLTAFDGSVVNISGGSVMYGFVADSGSAVNVIAGTVGQGFTALSGSVVNISGGTFEDDFFADFGSVVNISGGNLGDSFDSFDGSVVNISGGTFGNDFDVEGEVNILGSEFEIDGVALDTLLAGAELDAFLLGQSLTLFRRDVTLSGLLENGEAFSFHLDSINFNPDDYFSRNATLTVTLTVPEPSSATFIALVLAARLAPRRRS